MNGLARWKHVIQPGSGHAGHFHRHRHVTLVPWPGKVAPVDVIEAFQREHPDVSERVRVYVEQKAAIRALHHEKLYYWYYDKFGYALSADIDQARLERLATSACKQLEAS